MQRIKYNFLSLLLLISVLPVNHSAAPFRAMQQAKPSLAGKWEGVLSAGGTKLRLVLKIVEAPAGVLTASMDSLDQDAMGLEVDSITLKSAALHFEMKDLKADYEGVVSADATEVVGTWHQGGNSLSLIFRKSGSKSSIATVKRGSLEFKTCADPSLTKDALCGKFEVFEDRTGKAGRKIPLNIIILPAQNPKAAADATFYLAGGPGGAATTYATSQFMSGLRRERDVVLVDQRGTGQSNPLQCNFQTDRMDMSGYFGEPYAAEKVRACRDELQKIANLKLYTTSIAMDDLDDVRAALGYDRVNLYGGSYGSRSALVYLRQHPEHVRTVTVFGVAPTDAKFPLSFAKGVQQAMERLFSDCAADSACSAAYPQFREDFELVLKQFEKGPVEVNAPNIYTNKYQRFNVTRDAFVDAVRLVLYSPQVMSSMPLLVHLGAQGNLGPFIGTAFQMLYQLEGQIARGMQLSVICAEDTPFIVPEEIKRESAGTFYGDARVRPTIRACEDWPKAEVPQSFQAPIKNDAPVLLVSGELDPVTPPSLATPVARNLPNSKHLIVHNATHNSYECIEKIVAGFIDKGSLTALDTSCADQIQRLPFNIPKTN